MRPPRTLLTLAALPLTLAGCGAKPKQAAPPPALQAGKAGHIVIGPYVQPAGTNLSTSMNVVWWTDAPGKAELSWSNGTTGGTVAATQTRYEGLTRNVAAIERPANGARNLRYLASVTVGGERYTTAPVSAAFAPGRNEAMTWVALGDEGAGNAAERRVAEQAASHNPSLVVIAGDVVYGSGTWPEYRKNLVPQYSDLMRTATILPSLGNHDVGNPAHRGGPYRHFWTPPANWSPGPIGVHPYTILRRRANSSEGPLPASEMSLRNYSVDAGPVHYLALDSTADRQTLETMVVPWAKADLAAARQRGQTWFVAYWHHPPYTHGGYKDNVLQWQDIRDLFVPVMREAGVQIVLNGHDHNYQHMVKDGIHYIITAGGGAGLYKVDPTYDKNGQPPLLGYNDSVHSFTLFEMPADGKSMAVTQIDDQGKVLDKFTVER